MQAASRLRTALNEDRPTMGMWQMIPGANVSRILARTGVDWVCVDCEHGNIDGSYIVIGRRGIVTRLLTRRVKTVPCMTPCLLLRPWAFLPLSESRICSRGW